MSYVWEEEEVSYLMSEVGGGTLDGRGSFLYSEVQCIMGISLMWTGTYQNITFPQLCSQAEKKQIVELLLCCLQ